MSISVTLIFVEDTHTVLKRIFICSVDIISSMSVISPVTECVQGLHVPGKVGTRDRALRRPSVFPDYVKHVY